MFAKYTVPPSPVMKDGKEIWPVMDADKQVDQAPSRKQARSIAKRLNQQYDATLPKALGMEQALSFMQALGFQPSTMTQYFQDKGSCQLIGQYDRPAFSVMLEYQNIQAKTKRFIVKSTEHGVTIRAWWMN